MTTPLLLIGKPHSGKTTFIAQLYGRTESDASFLKLYKSVDDLTPIVDAVRSLANGDEVQTTPTDKTTVVKLPLVFNDGTKIDLNCPDYGGEQINKIIETRSVSSKWEDAIRDSYNWVLLVKPSDLTSSYDLSNKTINPETVTSDSNETEGFVVSDQSFFIELLQILLHTKGQDSHFRNATTKLTVVLTCWDELQTNAVPEIELESRLPLLSNYIKANWIKGYWQVLGLSSLGMSLKENGNREKYREAGAERFGYFINKNGKPIEDLTQLIIEATF